MMRPDSRGQTRQRVRVHRGSAARAFTLIELIVVVGMIALLAGGISIALGDAGGNALATGQKTLATMVGQARAQAGVGQTETLLAVYGRRLNADDATKFLSMLQVFRNSTPGVVPETWVPVGNPVTLPRGVYVVPPSTTGLLVSGVTWPTNPPLLSSFDLSPIGLGQPAGTPFGTPATAFVARFFADGTATPVGAQGYMRFVVATATVGTTGFPQFNNAAAVRGILVRPTGAVTFVNEAVGF